MSDDRVPDFALARAADILEKLARKRMEQRAAPPVPLDVPLELFNTHCRFAIGVTRRQAMLKALGIALPYPARGWHTYVVRDDGERRLLSCFFKDDVLIGLEYYTPQQKDGGPPAVPQDFGTFRILPGDVALGAPSSSLPASFALARGVPPGVVFEEAFEARYPGGVAYAMANGGRLVRLTLYTAPA